jgi:amino acid adenylation domain-containing protein
MILKNNNIIYDGKQVNEESLILEKFSYQVSVNSHEKAIIFGDDFLTYQELDDLSNSLASYLLKNGKGLQSKICVFIPKRIDLVVVLLGILKAGSVYVPIDSETPRTIVDHILNNCDCNLLITSKETHELIKDLKIDIINLDEIESKKCSSPQIKINKDDLAYIIYTSGSTGLPKGVEITHVSLANRLAWQQGNYHLSSDDVVLHKTSIGFDVSMWELLWSIVVGAKLVVCPQNVYKEPEKLLSEIIKNNVTVIHFVPSAFRIFIEICGCLEHSKLRLIICSGEELTHSICKLFFKYNNSNKIKLENLYGPTEATIDVTFFSVDKLYDVIPIGIPISNTQIYILDESSHKVLDGNIGEIFISGVGVARGYVNNSVLTEKAFLSDPFKNDGSKMYRTGDLGCFLSDGNIRYIGRKDNQIKIRGFRVELEGIENMLMKNLPVSQVVVVCKNDPDNEYEKFLVAYYSTSDQFIILEQKKVRVFLETILPFYMIPSMFIKLDEIPLKSNGKIDRAFLTNTENKKHDDEKDDYIEKIISDIWCEVLKLKKIGLHDNFFDLGGHSILALKIIARINKQLKIKLSFTEFFDNLTIVKLSESVRKFKTINSEKSHNHDVISQVSMFHLSKMQKRIWFIEQIFPNSVSYLYPLILSFKGSLNMQILKKALDILYRKHAALRVKLVKQAEVIYQKISKEDDDFNLKIFDLEKLDQETKSIKIKEIENSEANTAFSIYDEVLSRGSLIKINNNEYHLCLVFHHMIFDDWSKDIFLQNLSKIYSYCCDKNEKEIELFLNHKDYLQEDVHDDILKKETLENWKNYLQGFSNQPTLGFYEKERKNNISGCYYGKKFSCQNLLSIARSHNTTLYVVLLSAFKKLLSKLNNSSDIIIGITSSTRNIDTERSIGFYVNTLPLRTKISNSDSLDDIIQKIKKSILFVQDNNTVAFDEIVEYLNIPRVANKTPFFQIMINFWEENVDYIKFPENIRMQIHPYVNKNSKFDLELQISFNKDVLNIIYEYSESIYSLEEVESIAFQYENFLRSATKNLLHQRSPVSNSSIKDHYKKELVTIWSEVLNSENITEEDNFFDVGGNSFKLTIVKQLIKERLNKSVSIVDLFNYQNIKALINYFMEK